MSAGIASAGRTTPSVTSLFVNSGMRPLIASPAGASFAASMSAWWCDPSSAMSTRTGPIDSIRWEVFAESLQDYALLQTAGIKPDDALLAPLKSYADFPKDEAWLRHALEAVLNAPRGAAIR